ncbi:MarR family winged helix-turn-helix transcriptional regulator [Desulfolutivibrio sp.]|uniref:MarR family winged helix-turn-helix transcriptional regulator n=1 Tax=Desulfolutivibrio sp. TaxID=2773296 RepID=UPI002F961C13
MPMKQNDYIQNETLLCLTAWASRAMIADLNRRFHETGLRVTMEQWRALSHLCDREGLTQNELAALLLQEKTSVSRLLTGMQRRGYVARETHAHDGRCNRLLITDMGRDVLEKGCFLARLTLFAAEAEVSPDEMDTCRRVLSRIVHNLRGQAQPAQSQAQPAQSQAQPAQPQAQPTDEAACLQA